MDHQTDAPEGLGPSPVPPKLVLSNEVRASLQAVRVAQDAARVRARQQTLTTRVWFAASLAMLAAVGFTLAPRVARWRHGGVHAAPAAHPATTASERTAPSTPTPVTAVATMAAKAAASPEVAPTPGPAPTTAIAPAAAPALAQHAAAPESGCDTALIRSAPWRLSPEACAPVFDANPTDPRLALAIAHAEHVRGHFTESAQWATRALTLDPAMAEAYVLIARADVESGRQAEARAAYQRYLELAPRGWHKAEARTALERAVKTAPAASPGAR
jgi:tetratricopeptide (TPR) repeat protein